jgi:hypothetical protein
MHSMDASLQAQGRGLVIQALQQLELARAMHHLNMPAEASLDEAAAL